MLGKKPVGTVVYVKEKKKPLRTVVSVKEESLKELLSM